MNKKFSLEEIPEAQLKMLGLSKQDMLRLPTVTLNSLLNGERTSLLRLDNVQVGEQRMILDAKLSLIRDMKGEVKMMFHPINHELQNKYSLSMQEIKHLSDKEGNSVMKSEIGKDGKKNEYLYFLDQITNETVRINPKNLHAPDLINGKTLSEQDKENLVSGKEIKLGKNHYKIDPTTEIGIRETSGEDINELKFGKLKYGSKNLMIDAALLISGAGNIIILEHLIRMMYNNFVDKQKKEQQEALKNRNNSIKSLYLDKTVRNSAAEAAKKTKQTLNEEASKLGLAKTNYQSTNIDRMMDSLRRGDNTVTNVIFKEAAKNFDYALQKRGVSIGGLLDLTQEERNENKMKL
jgi:hypothetical protein